MTGNCLQENATEKEWLNLTEAQSYSESSEVSGIGSQVRAKVLRRKMRWVVNNLNCNPLSTPSPIGKIASMRKAVTASTPIANPNPIIQEHVFGGDLSPIKRTYHPTPQLFPGLTKRMILTILLPFWLTMIMSLGLPSLQMAHPSPILFPPHLPTHPENLSHLTVGLSRN